MSTYPSTATSGSPAAATLSVAGRVLRVTAQRYSGAGGGGSLPYSSALHHHHHSHHQRTASGGFSCSGSTTPSMNPVAATGELAPDLPALAAAVAMTDVAAKSAIASDAVSAASSSAGSGAASANAADSVVAGLLSRFGAFSTSCRLDTSRKPVCPFSSIDPSSWVPDAATSVCMAPMCEVPFSLFTRRSHCRGCGLIFCSSCLRRTLNESTTTATTTTTSVIASSSSSLGNTASTTAGDNGAPQRVCSVCFYAGQLAISQAYNGRHPGAHPFAECFLRPDLIQQVRYVSVDGGTTSVANAAPLPATTTPIALPVSAPASLSASPTTVVAAAAAAAAGATSSTSSSPNGQQSQQRSDNNSVSPVPLARAATNTIKARPPTFVSYWSSKQRLSSMSRRGDFRALPWGLLVHIAEYLPLGCFEDDAANAVLLFQQRHELQTQQQQQQQQREQQTRSRSPLSEGNGDDGVENTERRTPTPTPPAPAMRSFTEQGFSAATPTEAQTAQLVGASGGGGLFSFSLVCSDFYFASRCNSVWAVWLMRLRRDGAWTSSSSSSALVESRASRDIVIAGGGGAAASGENGSQMQMRNDSIDSFAVVPSPSTAMMVPAGASTKASAASVVLPSTPLATFTKSTSSEAGAEFAVRAAKNTYDDHSVPHSPFDQPLVSAGTGSSNSNGNGQSSSTASQSQQSQLQPHGKILSPPFSLFYEFILEAATHRANCLSASGARVHKLLSNGIRIAFLGEEDALRSGIVRGFVAQDRVATASSSANGSRLPLALSDHALGMHTFNQLVHIVLSSQHSSSSNYSSSSSASVASPLKGGIVDGAPSTFTAAANGGGGGGVRQSFVRIYDVTAGRRYWSLGRLAVKSSHAAVVCYDATSRQSLTKAALLFQEVATAARSRVTMKILCGVLPRGYASAASATSSSSSSSSPASIHDMSTNIISPETALSFVGSFAGATTASLTVCLDDAVDAVERIVQCVFSRTLRGDGAGGGSAGAGGVAAGGGSATASATDVLPIPTPLDVLCADSTEGLQ